MTSRKESHLTEEELILAVVDAGDLNGTQQHHLKICKQCASAVNLLEADLAGIGRQARASAPSLSRPIRLPEKQTKAAPIWSWRRARGFGMVFTALLILVVLWSMPRTKPPSDQGDSIENQTTLWQEDALMAEIRQLTENALPEEYQSLLVQSDEFMDEDFIRFIVPTVDTEPLSHESRSKGVKSC